MRINCLLIFVFFSYIHIYAQNIKIKGTVTDAVNRKPLSFTAIKIGNTGLGTVTNIKGEFNISLNDNYKTDTLEFSHLGYENKKIAIADCINKNADIKLKRLPYQIHELVVKPFSPTDLIDTVYNRMSKNYPEYPVIMQAFFRETIRQDTSLIQEIVADMEIYKSSYTKWNDRDGIRFVRSAINKNVLPSKLWDYMFFIDGPYEVIYSDVVRYRKLFMQVPEVKTNFMAPAHYKLYSYNFEKWDKSDSIIISFKPNEEYKRGVFEGKIIIDRKTKALIYLEYQYAPDRLNRVRLVQSDTETALNTVGVYTPVVLYSTITKYKQVNGKWMLNSVVNKYGFEFYEGGDSPKSIIIVCDELQITGYRFENVKPFRYSKSVIRGKKLTDQINPADSGYFYINPLPTESEKTNR